MFDSKLQDENDLLRVLVRALARQAGGRVIVSRADLVEAARCVLEILPGRDADGTEQVYVQSWPVAAAKRAEAACNGGLDPC